MTPVDSNALRVLVVQMGARRDYELARMLEQKGVLAALQTSAASAEGRRPGFLARTILASNAPAATRRTVRGVSQQKVRTTFLPEIVGAGLRKLSVEIECRYRVEDWALGWAARWRGLAGANVVLSTCGNGGLDFLHWAKKRGAKIATDVVITPLVYEIVAQEHARWPDWMPARYMRKTISAYRRHMECVVSVSDLLLCPSDAVVEGLATLRGFRSDKIARISYGLGATRLTPGQPIAKRVLFAGEAGLRKGLPYLAEAARCLRARDPGYEVRVAGTVDDAIRNRPECKDLTFLGHLGPESMAEEFRLADVFCLPSLAEGMASVTLEALAHGIPCVVTPAAGAPIVHDCEGLIVPERSGVALSDAITQIAGDRARRERMSAAALRRAAKHEPSVIADELCQALLRLAA
jgi:glycosyltransferase involved in cell wall biosynthesis